MIHLPPLPKRPTIVVSLLSLLIAIFGIVGIYIYSPAALPGHFRNHVNDHASTQIDLLKGEWKYMPSSTVTTGGLIISSRNFSIVEQDGAGGQPNPPVNEYGTHLNVRGDFRVNAQLANLHGADTIRLYASPPQVSDEFRVEPKSIAVTIKSHTITAAIWNGSGSQDLANQKPVGTKNFSFNGNSRSVKLGIATEGDHILLTVNNIVIGSLLTPDLFASTNQVWIGFSAQGNAQTSFTVEQLTANALGTGTISMTNTAAGAAISKSSAGLQTLVNTIRPGFLMGTDLTTWAASSSPSYSQAVFGGNFGIVTPENAMKWEFTEPEPGVYDFNEADAVVAMAKKNGLEVHGHNLVFGEALPDWVQNLPIKTVAQKAYVRQVLYDHVYTTVRHFKGQVNEWDINEPFAYYDSAGRLPTNTLVNSVFYRALGANYVQVVAEAAIAANPSVQLWINDYGAENDSGAYWNRVYTQLKEWKVNQGLPIYGYGFESHIYDPVNDDIANADDDNGTPILTDHINELAAIGLKSRISELDAPQSDPGYSQDDSSQAQQFAGTLQICLSNPNCVAFSTWSTGMTDLYQTSDHQLQESVDSMFDLQNKPDSAYQAVQTFLERTIQNSNKQPHTVMP
jgi:endo-1,4-beta-xylanase